MKPDVSNRVILITGAASGIGAACASRLAAEGTSLLLTTRSNGEALEQVAATCRDKGARVECVRADLTRPEAADLLVAAAIERFGQLDQIVSNAGRGDKRTFGDFGRTDLEDALRLNTLPFLDLVLAALRWLEKSAIARIVFISSFVNHNIGIDHTIFPLTAASKSATEGLAATLAYQLAGKRITVNGVAPGYTRKDGGHAAIGADAWKKAAQATPSGRIANPADIAAAVNFFLSAEAEHITGQLLRVDGGLSLI